MKTRATLFLLLVAAAAGALWFSASVSATEKKPTLASHNVVINREGIVIPGTEISKADQEAMNTILNKYDKSLYRIDTYENGKLKKTQGKLTDVVTDKQLASEIAANVKRTGFTQSAVQIRAGTTANSSNPLKSSNPSPNPGATANSSNPLKSSNPSPNPGATANSSNPLKSSNPAKHKSDEMMERLKPILKKYQKK